MNHTYFLINLALSFALNGIAHAAFTPANRPYDVKQYTLSFEMDPALDLKTHEGSVKIEATTTSNTATIELDAEELKIHQVRLNGVSKPLHFQQNENKLTITLPKTSRKGQNWVLNIDYAANIRTAHSGFFKVTDPDDATRGPLYFTHFEPLAARTFFPSNDEPYDKAKTVVIGSVPEGYQVLSNGKRLKDKIFTRHGRKWRKIQWVMEKPHSTYLVAIAVGKFGKLTDYCNGKAFTVWVGSQKLDKAKYALDVTRRSCEFFESYLGVKYPWNKYDTVGVPTFVWGGMENTSSTHMNQERTLLNDPNSAFEKKKIAGLAAHELAHQWFGDYVTMKWWNDVWLNESFASLMGTLATEHIFKSEEALIETVTDAWDSYFREEDGPRSHPIVDNNLESADDAFDSTNYTKGENILRMLSFFLGEEKFKKGVTHYLNSYGGKNASHLDLFASMEKASGINLNSFRTSWLLNRGYPIINYAGEWDKNTSTYRFTLSQRPNHAEDSTVFTFKIPVVFHRKATPAYSKTIVLEIDKADVATSITLDEAPDWVSVNPGAIVLGKVRQADRDESILALQSKNDPDPMIRVWANLELASPLRQGNQLSDLAEETLLGSLSNDPSPYVRIAILENFKVSKTRWLPQTLGTGLFAIAAANATDSTLLLSDKHGWSEYRSNLLGALGRVEGDKVLAFLETTVKNPQLPLDELGQVALAIATQGDPKSAAILKTAIATHHQRGYRYRYLIHYAFGAYENPQAAQEIKLLSAQAGSDLMGKIGNLVQDNNTLKNSKEWAQFLGDFVLTDTRFGEEIKTRILGTIEEVKTDAVKEMLELIAKDGGSKRLQDVSKKILKKNFKG